MIDSILLARFFGILLVIVYGGLLLNAKYYQQHFRKILEHPLLILLSGVIKLVIGLWVLLNHWVWSNWSVVITVIALLFAIAGFLRVVFPKAAARMVSWFFEKKQTPIFFTTLSIGTLVGIFLILMGFIL